MWFLSVYGIIHAFLSNYKKLNLMKNILILNCLIIFIGVNYSIYAQDEKQNFIERNPIYDYTELQLNNTDTIPGFESKLNKLKISGTIYNSDGVTPAKNIILFIKQADEYGDFDLRKRNDKRFVHNRGWIKTNSDGQYTFYTFVPGNDRRYNQLQQLFPVIKEPSKQEYNIATFLFDDDPLLSKRCRKRIAKKDDPTRILKLKKENGLYVTQRDIVLSSGN
jgi:protocatechuate 3,4-dioxygenase beta subunit